MGIAFYAIFYFVYIMQSQWNEIEKQLKKRWQYSYKWLRKQNDQWDVYTNFIYTISDWDALIKAVANLVHQENLNKGEAFYYAVNRWYNFWSAVAVEEIFCSQLGVVPAGNAKDKQVDFFINNIPFDHKTSVFPKGFGKDIAFAKANKKQLIQWLYTQQSSQQRQHFANRLFVIVYATDGDHWKLKAEISLLRKAVSDYVATFDAGKLIKLTFFEEKIVLSDIIWVTQ